MVGSEVGVIPANIFMSSHVLKRQFVDGSAGHHDWPQEIRTPTAGQQSFHRAANISLYPS